MTDAHDSLDASRFVVGRRLGQGGMGVVFEAYDRHRQETVALKTLMYTDGAAVYRLKQEFRTLANVAHPNLVSLYELFAEGDKWFFTMELVEGATFIDHVRPSLHDTRFLAPGPGATAAGTFDPVRLRSALKQLAEGVRALHLTGTVHRDLKPSNVLVTDDGRVVILDLGIARDLRPDAPRTTASGWAVGTAGYMSPEQARGEVCTQASDWYSVGSMLYEALSGTLPFVGPPLAVLSRKQTDEATPVEEVAPGVPTDLAELCRALLSRDPEARPAADDVLDVLGVPDRRFRPASGARELRPIVGRRRELDALEQAFHATARGRTVTVYLHGLSGMGKSTLVEHFLQRLVAERRAVVLSGRCYDRESVPYKALDGVIDSLSHHLKTLGPGELQDLLPSDVHTLARLFPVLGRIDAIRASAFGAFVSPEPVELRRRAIDALRELLTRIAARSPLVVHVDDLQWTDADSIALGTNLLSRGDPPPILLLLSFRSEDVSTNPSLTSFLEEAGSDTKREISLGPLTRFEGAELATSLLGQESPLALQFVDGIVHEAAGSPFFIEQLAHHVREDRTTTAVGLSLAEMVEARVSQLPAGAHELLRTFAVAGRPVDSGTACRAAGLVSTTSDARGLVGALRAANMIRPSGRSDRMELYHDRIRAEIAARVGADEASRIHGRLAQAITEQSLDDPEALFEHYLGAGEIERAGQQAARAAQRAADALAFDRAASLYRRAIDIGSSQVSDLPAWYAGLGEALANAGRPGDAAEAFLVAAGHAPSAADAIRYRRSAAEWFLIGGHNDRGLEVTRGLLHEVGLRMPTSPRKVLGSLMLHRVQIRLRGLDYEVREEDRASEIDLLRMDICWACAIGLTMTDYIVAAYFQARYMLLALAAGEAHRIARALAFEVGFVSARGVIAKDRTAKVAAEAQALAERLGSPREIGMAAVTTGSASCMLGDFKRAAELCAEAEQILRDRCTGVQWELTTCQIFLLASLTYLGETAEVARRVPILIESARERGNLFEGIELRTRQNLYWLLNDDPAGARRELSEAMSQWSREGFYRQDYNSLLANAQIDLYVGDASTAWSRTEDAWPAIRRSQLMRVQLLRCEMLHMRARAAIADAARGQGRAAKLRKAGRIAQRIAREQAAWSAPFTPLLEAGIAYVRGDEIKAVARLAKALAGFEAAHMGLYAAASRRRLGEVIGGDEGRRLVDEAESFMLAQSIKAPDRLAAMLVPGFDV